jgi:hypothetical protein
MILWENSIPGGNFSDFSDDFLMENRGSSQESTGKKPEQYPTGILFPYSSNFRCFPAGFGRGNLRPEYTLGV